MYFSCPHSEKNAYLRIFSEWKGALLCFHSKKMRIYAIFQSENDLVKRKISNFAPDKN